jgi:hypothetical protein
VPQESFGATIDEIVTKKLHPAVPAILWTSVASRISGTSVAIDRHIGKVRVLLNKKDEETLWDSSAVTSWGAHHGYRRCIDHYNNLVDIHDELLHHGPFPITEISPLGSSFERDPAVHLTTCACKVLSTEMDRIEALLYHARVINRQQDN